MRASTLIGTSRGTAAAAIVGSVASRLGVTNWYPALAAAALAVSSADLTRRTARVNPVAGLTLTPYPAWCAFR